MGLDGMCRLELHKLAIHKDKLLNIARIGLPAGLQGAIFSISNVLIQSSVNSFGAIAMAGNTAAGNLEGFVYTSMNSVYQTNLSFTSQNMGAGNRQRMKKILGICLILVSVVGLVLGNGFVFSASSFSAFTPPTRRSSSTASTECISSAPRISSAASWMSWWEA